jgi:membrane associated rhomboid family serine protease
MRHALATTAAAIFTLFTLAVFLFMALAWPVFGFREPTIALIICLAIFGLMALIVRDTPELAPAACAAADQH